MEEAADISTKDVQSMLTEIKDMCGEVDVISFVLLLTGDADTPDEAEEMVAKLLDELDTIKKYIGDTIIVFSTDKKGNASALNFTIDITFEETWGQKDVYKNTIEISGSGKLTLNGSKDLGLDDIKDLAEELFSHLDLKDGDRILTASGEKVVYRNGDKMLIAYDAEFLMSSQPSYMEQHGEEEIDGVTCQKYTVMWYETTRDSYNSYVLAYGLYTEKRFSGSIYDTCGDWLKYEIVGNRCDVY